MENSTLLLEAAKEGNIAEVARLIDAGIDVNHVYGPWRDTAFLVGVEDHHADGVIVTGADRNAPPSRKDCATALQLAAGTGSLDVVKMLLDAGADIHAPGPGSGGLTALQVAAGAGLLDMVKLLLNACADVNAPGSNIGGRTALRVATGTGSLDMVKILLDAGADPNARGSQVGGRTPLQVAAGASSLDMVQLLLNAGANVNARALYLGGRTALRVAAGGGSLDMVKLLLNAGADVNAPAQKGDLTALQCAAGGQSLDMLKILLVAGAIVNTPAGETYSKTALQLAALSGSMDMVQLLLTAGSLPDQTGYKGQTVFHYLCAGGKIDILRPLLSLDGSGGNSRNSNGSTPLHVAVEEECLDYLNVLIESGVDLNVEDNTGMTPLAIAILHGAVTRLLEVGASTSTLTVDKLPSLLSLGSSAGRGDVIILRGGRTRPMSVESLIEGTSVADPNGILKMKYESWGPISRNRSFYFLQYVPFPFDLPMRHPIRIVICSPSGQHLLSTRLFPAILSLLKLILGQATILACIMVTPAAFRPIGPGGHQIHMSASGLRLAFPYSIT